MDGNRRPTGEATYLNRPQTATDTSTTPMTGWPVPTDAAPATRTTTSVGQLLTAEQLAQRWQVPKSHIYRPTREGAVPTVRLGRYYRYRLDAIERFEVGQLNRHVG